MLRTRCDGFQSPRRWGGVGLLASVHRAIHGYQVSIPSEVGRGRALACDLRSASIRPTAFQSPRRWGGVGLDDSPSTMADGLWFQSPRRWGGVGLCTILAYDSYIACDASFNPLGGGAGSGSHAASHVQSRCVAQSIGSMFQSPRRWGGVGLSTHRMPWSRSRLAGFNPLGGGAGSGSSIWQALLNAIVA